MITANHKKWADMIFKKYIYKLLKKHFHSINLLNKLPELKPDIPLILTPNHATWWDGFFVYLLNNEYIEREFYIMILEEQLSKLKFFPKLGGFSINQNSPKKIIESLNYSAEMMKTNSNSVFNIFPQGELLPVHTEPIIFNNGIKKIIEIYDGDVQVLNLAMKPFFLKEQNPNMFFKFGKLHTYNAKQNIDMKSHQNEMELLLIEIDNSILINDFGKIILEGKKSVSG